MAKFGDKRSKKGREEALMWSICAFIFKIIATLFKLVWFVFKALFHIVTLGKFKSTKEEKNE